MLKLSPSIATTVELNVEKTVSLIPSPVRSTRTGGVIIPLCGSVYSGRACSMKKYIRILRRDVDVIILRHLRNKMVDKPPHYYYQPECFPKTPVPPHPINI